MAKHGKHMMSEREMKGMMGKKMGMAKKKAKSGKRFAALKRKLAKRRS